MPLLHARLESLILLPLALLMFLTLIPSQPASAIEPETEHPASTQPTTATAADFAAARLNNQFTLDLFKQIRQQQGNLILSPYGARTALSIICKAANGPTKDQIQNALHLPGDTSSAPTTRPTAPGPLGSNDGLYVANGFWLRKDLTLNDHFAARILHEDHALLEPLDFADPTRAAARINSWVADQTANRIKGFLDRGDIDLSAQAFIITNAVYFKGQWSNPFNPRDTYDGQFSISDHEKMTVAMMRATENFPYYQGDGIELVQLPIAQPDAEVADGDQYAMTIILPVVGKELSDVENNLTEKKLKEWLEKSTVSENEMKAWAKRAPGDDAESESGPAKFASLERQWMAQCPMKLVTLSLPRFEFYTRFDLIPALAKLGIIDAFSQRKADFSGLLKDNLPKLWLSAILQKAFIHVDERGVQAGAATAIGGIFGGPEGAPLNLVINRPFLCLIQEKKSGRILFIGRVARPQELTVSGPSPAVKESALAPHLIAHDPLPRFSLVASIHATTEPVQRFILMGNEVWCVSESQRGAALIYHRADHSWTSWPDGKMTVRDATSSVDGKASWVSLFNGEDNRRSVLRRVSDGKWEPVVPPIPSALDIETLKLTPAKDELWMQGKGLLRLNLRTNELAQYGSYGVEGIEGAKWRAISGDQVHDLQFTADGRYAVCACGNDLNVIDLHSGAAAFYPSTQSIQNLYVAPDNNTVWCNAGKLLAFDLAKKQWTTAFAFSDIAQPTTDNAHAMPLPNAEQVLASRDGKILWVMSYAGTGIYSATSGTWRVLDASSEHHCMCPAADGMHILCATGRGVAIVGAADEPVDLLKTTAVSAGCDVSHFALIPGTQDFVCAIHHPEHGGIYRIKMTEKRLQPILTILDSSITALNVCDSDIWVATSNSPRDQFQVQHIPIAP